MRSVYIICKTAIARSALVRSIITLAAPLCVAFICDAQITPPQILFPQYTGVSNQKLVCRDTITLVGNAPGPGEGAKWIKNPFFSFNFEFVTSEYNDTVVVRLLSQGPAQFYYGIGSSGDTTFTQAPVYLSNQSPSEAKLPSDFNWCSNNVEIKANAPLSGENGNWQVIAGGGGITTGNAPTAQILNLTLFVNKFVWSITNSKCPSIAKRDTVTVNNYTPSKAVSGANNPVCSDSTFLQANAPNPPTIGEWRSLAVSPKPTIVDPNNPNSKVLNLSAGNNNFVWRTYVDSRYCVDSVKVTINASQPQTALIFGETFADTALCNDRLWLKGNKAQAGSSNTWTLVNGSGSISWPTRDTTWINALGLGVDSVVYTISNSLCGSSKASLRITNNSVTTPLSVKDSCFLSPFASSLDLKLKNSLKAGESGQWSLLKAPSMTGINFNTTGLTTANFQPSKSGIYRFRYDAENSFACSSSTSSSYYLITKASLPNDSCVVNASGSAISISVKAKQVPRLGERERGEWIISPSPLGITRNDSVLSFTAASGVFSITYSIRNDSCTTCNTTCPNTDQMTVTVITKPKINAYTSCFLSASLNLSSNAPASGEVARWRSPSSLLISDTIFSPTQISNIKIGKSIVIRAFSHNGCVASDTAKLTRVTTPNAGKDTCIVSGISDLNYTVTGNLWSRANGEVAQWRLASNSTALNFSPLADTIRGVLKDSKNNGVYSLTWGIRGVGCPVFYDTVRIGLVTKPIIPLDTSFTIPFATPTPTLTGNPTALGSNESSNWQGPNNLFVSGQTLTMPSLGAGTYQFRYSITDSSKLKMCTFSRTIAVTYLTTAQIKKSKLDTCLKAANSLTLVANSLPASDSGVWYVDKLKYPQVDVNQVLDTAEKATVYLNGNIYGKFVVYWKTYSKGFTSIDSIRITNLTKPIATGSFCAKDTFMTISPPAAFPVRQPYEKAYWIKKSTGVGSFLSDSLVTTIHSLQPGQIQLATVITDKTSSCADTSSPVILTTVTKAKAFETPYICLTDTFADIMAKPFASGEKGQWTYKNSSFGVTPVIVNAKQPNAFVYGLGQRRTTLRWTIKNIADSSCLSSDSVNSRVVVSSKATVGYQDTCIVGSTTVQLRAIRAKPYERQGWLRSSSPDTLSRSERFSFPAASLGLNTFMWVIYDTTYKQCRSSAIQRATVLNKPEIAKATTCLIKSASTVLDTLVSNGNLSGTTRQIWKKDPLFSSDTLKLLSSTPSQVVYKAIFSASGKRSLIWRDSASAFCYSDDTIQVTVISKATAGISSTCVKDSVDTLKTVPLSQKEFGAWSVNDFATATISGSNDTTASVKFLKQGRAVFTWTVTGEDQSCKDSSSVSAVFLSKARFTGDTCFSHSTGLTSDVEVPALAANENGLWKGQPLIFSSVSSTSYKVTGFVLGSNPAVYKIWSQYDPSCNDSVKAVFRTLTPADFFSISPMFICSQERTVRVDAGADETILWSLEPSPWKTKSFNKDSISLFKLSNDTTYTLYRRVGSAGGCSLTDSLKIRNRQLDPIKVVPLSSSDILQVGKDSFFTCRNFWYLDASNPIADIETSDTARWETPYAQPAANFDKLEVTRQKTNTVESNLRYVVTNMGASGNYRLTYRVSNGSFCPALTQTINIEKRTGIVGMADFFRDTVCSAEYTFDKFKQYPKDAESVKWTKSIQFFNNDTLNDPPNVTVTNLQEGDNRLSYTAFKGGCIGTTTIVLISNTNAYTVDILGDPIQKNCETDTVTLNANISLSERSLLSFYWTSQKGQKVDSNIVSITPKDSLRQRAKVSKLAYNQPNNFYFMTKNGKCNPKYDSVAIYNYSKLVGITAGINVPIVCGTAIGAFATKPPFALGKWSIDDSTVTFDNVIDDTTVIRNLKTREQPYKLKWAVNNGVCYSEVNSEFTVADEVSSPVILSTKSMSLCDVDNWVLKADAPSHGQGAWYLNGSLLSSDSAYEYRVPTGVNSQFYKFVWRVYNPLNEYCQGSDTVKVAYYRAPSKAIAGESQALVTDKTNLNATPVEVGIGSWEVTKGSGIVSEVNNPRSEVTNLNFGDNFFKWTVRNGTCKENTDQVVISFKDFSIPQGFSPNGDAKNDKFEIKGIENYTGTELLVYNRWGREVYSSNNYQNSWDGDGLDEDTYYYVMTLVNGRKYTGYVVLKRK